MATPKAIPSVANGPAAMGMMPSPGWLWTGISVLPSGWRWGQHDDLKNGRGLTPRLVRRLLPEVDGRLIADRMIDDGFCLYHLGPGLYWHHTRPVENRGDVLIPFSIMKTGVVLVPGADCQHYGSAIVNWASGHRDPSVAESVFNQMSALRRRRKEVW